VTEAIELLLDADQWQPADNLYQTRCDNGYAWMTLPAARLGQRTATAFVATPARRDACAAHLTLRRLGFYLNETGLFATRAGDLASGRDYLTLAARHDRDTGDTRNLAVCLQNLVECLGRLGLAGPALEAATEALTSATAADDQRTVGDTYAYLGWLAGLVGDATAAEGHFTTADQLRRTDDPDADHLYSFYGVLWAQWLALTGRPGPGPDPPQRRDMPRERLA
jgi:tetratricopeptide (TPR) repeat protein